MAWHPANHRQSSSKPTITSRDYERSPAISSTSKSIMMRNPTSAPSPPRIVTHLSAPSGPTRTLGNGMSGKEEVDRGYITADWAEYAEEGIDEIPAIPGSGSNSRTRYTGSSRPLPPRPQTQPPAQARGQTPSPLSEAAPSPALSLNGSPLRRQHPSRPLSPDLPYRDALYLFCNFSSYMRSPGEGAEGIRSEDLRDTVRLLEYARSLAAQPYNNVHVLHLKYRFEHPISQRTSSATSSSPQHQHQQQQQQQQLEQTHRRDQGVERGGSSFSAGDSGGLEVIGRHHRAARLRNPVPQPFSVLHDAVVKVDYRNDGVFEPLPAQAVFTHIAQACHPPPRIIVVSYVNSVVTQNHLASLSLWARASSPPIYIFSPFETRIRETLDVPTALLHAIPISMYATPYGPYTPSPSSLTPTSRHGYPNHMALRTAPTVNANAKLIRRHSDASIRPHLPQGDTNPPSSLGHLPDFSGANSGSGSSASVRPTGPIASLTVITDPPRTSRSLSFRLARQSRSANGNENGSGNEGGDGDAQPHSLQDTPPSRLQQIERIPLWALAPGVGVLHGSTSASIGVKLEDFSAVNLGKQPRESTPLLVDPFRNRDGTETTINVEGANGGMVKQLARADLAGVTTVAQTTANTQVNVTVQASAKPGLTVERLLHSDVESSSSRPITPVIRPISGVGQAAQRGTVQHTERKPVQGERQFGKHLTPPDQRPDNLMRSQSQDVYTIHTLGGESASWSTPRARVSGWRRGRKEHVEDILEELGLDVEEETGKPDQNGEVGVGIGRGKEWVTLDRGRAGDLTEGMMELELDETGTSGGSSRDRLGAATSGREGIVGEPEVAGVQVREKQWYQELLHCLYSSNGE